MTRWPGLAKWCAKPKAEVVAGRSASCTHSVFTRDQRNDQQTRNAAFQIGKVAASRLLQNETRAAPLIAEIARYLPHFWDRFHVAK